MLSDFLKVNYKDYLICITAIAKRTPDGSLKPVFLIECVAQNKGEDGSQDDVTHEWEEDGSFALTPPIRDQDDVTHDWEKAFESYEGAIALAKEWIDIPTNADKRR